MNDCWETQLGEQLVTAGEESEPGKNRKDLVLGLHQ